jgi:amino acid transporter
MRSTAAAPPSVRARRASHSPAARGLARAGLAARGVLYILIGWVAILVAFGQTSGSHASQAGALHLLAGQPYGLVLLWLLGIGFAGYALWRFSEAAFGVAGEGTGAGPRLKSVVRGLVYAFFAYLTFEIIAGTAGNSAKKQQDLTAKVMHHPGGQLLVGIVGAVIVIIGVALVIEGLRRKFLKNLRTSQMSPRARRVVERLGMIGTAARGVVFALAGVLVIDAAATYKPAKAGGIDKALLTLRDQPFGQVLLILAALGLIIFGIYGLCEARWRKV